jgi:hypothetical protein
MAIATDSAGNLYVADNIGLIRMVTLQGVITRIGLQTSTFVDAVGVAATGP